MRKDTFKARRTLTVNGKSYDYFSLKAVEEAGIVPVSKLPNSMKVLLENLLRNEDGFSVFEEDVKAVGAWAKERKSTKEINYYPARVLMQDFTGVPAVVDLAALRDAIVKIGGDAQKINPLNPVDLVIDHSVMIDYYGTKDAFQKNVDIEFERNQERYEFLKWGQKAFKNFRVVPPGTGICHQVNLENLAQVVWTKEEDGKTIAYCDTCVGTDSHTTMINGLSVLGWGVGGIEAEAAMLGQAVTMLIPEVIGFKLTGKLKEGTTATDLVLTVTNMLRKKGVVDKFVEFYGEGLANLSLADRATLANMAPEYGATCGFFPVDKETINYLKLTSRDADRVKLVEEYAKAQGMWWEPGTPDPVFTDTLELDITTVVPTIAGPSRPQDKILLTDAASTFAKALDTFKVAEPNKKVPVVGESYDLSHGDVVIAAITSCTNTSNPSVLVAAGLVARKAAKLGLKTKPWVKTSLAPGSQVVQDYLAAADLQGDLDALGFNIVGFGCTTCIGNSGPLPEKVSNAIKEGNLVAGAVLSGNRNFEGRISPFVKANFLASPPLVVAYAIAGSMKIDVTKDAIGTSKDGKPVYLKDIWPTNQEVSDTVARVVTSEMFKNRYSDVFKGGPEWQKIAITESETYSWNTNSTYVQNPPYFVGMKKEIPGLKSIAGAKVLALFGDSVTTDHISPAGDIAANSPAGDYLKNKGVEKKDFNSYGARRGNHEVMMRGTFANIRIKNEMLGGEEGGNTLYNGQKVSIYDASMKHQSAGTPLVIFAGKEYGTGSSRDWAAKGTNLLGVKAVIAESFERIHRSNLIGMGVLPFVFKAGQDRKTLNLKGDETVDIQVPADFKPRQDIKAVVTRADGSKFDLVLESKVNTANELEYVKNGGILHYVLRNISK